NLRSICSAANDRRVTCYSYCPSDSPGRYRSFLGSRDRGTAGSDEEGSAQARKRRRKEPGGKHENVYLYGPEGAVLAPIAYGPLGTANRSLDRETARTR